MFLKPNIVKIIIFAVLFVLGYFCYQYALNHLMDCFLQSECQRSITYYLIIPIITVILVPVYCATALITLIVNPKETMLLLNLTYVIIGMVYYYFLACVVYLLWVKFEKRNSR
jgi:hypothetical protein